MSLARALFGRAKTDWETPPELFAVLDREFCFTLDVCATAANRKCAAYFGRHTDALHQSWTGTCWMNPPYGRAVGRWVAKAVGESSKGATVVCLLPARTDTAWWQELVMRANQIRLLRGRLTFVGAASTAPFPSAVAIFKRSRAGRTPSVIAWDWRRIARSRPVASARRAALPPSMAA